MPHAFPFTVITLQITLSNLPIFFIFPKEPATTISNQFPKQPGHHNIHTIYTKVSCPIQPAEIIPLLPPLRIPPKPHPEHPSLHNPFHILLTPTCPPLNPHPSPSHFPSIPQHRRRPRPRRNPRTRSQQIRTTRTPRAKAVRIVIRGRTLRRC